MAPEQGAAAPAEAASGPGKHERRPDPGDRRRDQRPTRIKGAVLVLGVLLVQLAFILSYVGSFHSPTPHDVSVAVVGPSPVAGQTATQLNSLDGHPLQVRTAADEAAARALLTDQQVYGALLIGPDNHDTLLVAGGAGTSVTAAVEQVLTQADTAQQRTLSVSDVVPVSTGDNRGLSGFYLAVGWVVGGYLLATALAVAGSKLRVVRARSERLAVIGAYSVLSGLGGAFIVEHLLQVYSSHYWQLAALGTLVVFASAAFTVALETVLDFVGIGLVILLFVVLGNPSAGGAYGTPLLPPFWAAVGPWLTPGAAVEGIRSIVYFDGTGVAQPIWVLAGYAVFGVVLTVGAAWFRGQRTVTAQRVVRSNTAARPCPPPMHIVSRP